MQHRATGVTLSLRTQDGRTSTEQAPRGVFFWEKGCRVTMAGGKWWTWGQTMSTEPLERAL